MATIFDCETELGKCDPDWLQERLGVEKLKADATVYAHTLASLTRSNQLLKIEQRCYVRAGGDLPDQPWVKPQMLLEPALPSLHANLQLLREIHQSFVHKARTELPEECLAPSG